MGESHDSFFANPTYTLTYIFGRILRKTWYTNDKAACVGLDRTRKHEYPLRQIAIIALQPRPDTDRPDGARGIELQTAAKCICIAHTDGLMWES